MESQQIGLRTVLQKMHEHLTGLNAQIELFKSGKVRIFTGGPEDGRIDETERTIERLHSNVAEIRAIIDEVDARIRAVGG